MTNRVNQMIRYLRNWIVSVASVFTVAVVIAFAPVVLIIASILVIGLLLNEKEGTR